jgi:hypothetical protein
MYFIFQKIQIVRYTGVPKEPEKSD